MKYYFVDIKSVHSRLSKTLIVTILSFSFLIITPWEAKANESRCHEVLLDSKSWFKPQSDPTSPPYFDELIGTLDNPGSSYKKINIEWGNKLEAYNVTVIPQKEAEFRAFSDQLKNAGSYEEGVALLRTALREVGLIRHYDRLVLRHASRLPPSVILKTGIYSANEAEARLGTTPSMTGQKSGDGVYTIGSVRAGWDDENTWGVHQYQIEYRNVDIFHSKNRYANSFMELYFLLRRKWNKSMDDGFDGKMAVGMAHEHITGAKWAYEDFGIIGSSLSLEVLLKVRVVPPENITYQGSRK